MVKRAKIAGLIALLACLPSVAMACPGCQVSSEESRFAYYASTGILSVLPLIMIGAVVFYLVKKTRAPSVRRPR